MSSSADIVNPGRAVSERPRHIAIVMDGNGRWATRRGKARSAGHRAGVKAARRCVELAMEAGIEYLTLFAFSSENWNRPRREVGLLMDLFVEALQREVSDLHSRDIRLKFIGDRSSLSDKLQRMMGEGEALTINNTAMTVVLAVSFGGRWDIAQAARSIAEAAIAGRLAPQDVDDALVRQHLSLGDLPDPDLFIRTGGERRISNFMLWDLAYTELYFSDVLWPDFDTDTLEHAISFFAGRERRFGRTTAQLENP